MFIYGVIKIGFKNLKISYSSKLVEFIFIPEIYFLLLELVIIILSLVESEKSLSILDLDLFLNNIFLFHLKIFLIMK